MSGIRVDSALHNALPSTARSVEITIKDLRCHFLWIAHKHWPEE